MTATMTAKVADALPPDFPVAMKDFYAETRTREIRRMQVRFERWLPVLISSRGSRVVKQLESSKAMTLCRKFIADFYEAIVEAGGQKSLSRFLSGEFTGNIKPLSIVKMVKGDVGDLVETATIIEVMQEKFDSGEWIAQASTEFQGMPVVASDAVPDGTIVMVPQQTADQIARGEIPTPIVITDISPEHNGEIEDITPDRQVRLDAKVSALPPPMSRHPRPVRKGMGGKRGR